MIDLIAKDTRLILHCGGYYAKPLQLVTLHAVAAGEKLIGHDTMRMVKKK